MRPFPFPPQRLVLGALGVVVSLGSASSDAQRTATYDRVILGGRVIDPASHLDAVRNVGVSNGKIAIVTAAAIRGRDTVDARGLVVTPGFIDLHSHGQNAESYAYYAMDGVTTALEMEIGVWPVAQFYADREGRALVNFGGTTSHFAGRRAFAGEEVDFDTHWTDTRNRWAYQPTTPALMDTVRAVLARGLDEGALGIGMGVAYTPGASRVEIYRNFELCTERRVVCFTHMRGGVEGLQEVLSDAMATGASLQIVHINSSSGRDFPLFARFIHAARAHGVDVSTEAYPYTASSTLLQSALFDSALTTPAYDFSRIVWAATGEHLNRDTFIKYRAIGGTIVQLGGPDSLLNPIFADTIVSVASDAVPYVQHRGHPRLAGTFARVLGRFVREQQAMSLPEAIRRMTIMPAQRMERSVPAMALKGRLRVGADADVTVFDASRVIDRATVEDPARYSAGIIHVLVNGTPVVRNEKLVEGVAPGRGVRRTLLRRATGHDR